jgi:hypothetical protein
MYFTLLVPATCFGSLYHSHLQAAQPEDGFDRASWKPKHVAESSNIKYIPNFNNNHQLSCGRLYIL